MRLATRIKMELKRLRRWAAGAGPGNANHSAKGKPASKIKKKEKPRRARPETILTVELGIKVKVFRDHRSKAILLELGVKLNAGTKLISSIKEAVSENENVREFVS